MPSYGQLVGETAKEAILMHSQQYLKLSEHIKEQQTTINKQYKKQTIHNNKNNNKTIKNTNNKTHVKLIIMTNR